MIDTALVEETPGSPMDNRDQPRRCYRLTVFDWQVTSLELQRLKAVMNAAPRKQLMGAPVPQGAS